MKEVEKRRAGLLIEAEFKAQSSGLLNALRLASAPGTKLVSLMDYLESTFQVLAMCVTEKQRCRPVVLGIQELPVRWEGCGGNFLAGFDSLQVRLTLKLPQTLPERCFLLVLAIWKRVAHC